MENARRSICRSLVSSAVSTNRTISRNGVWWGTTKTGKIPRLRLGRQGGGHPLEVEPDAEAERADPSVGQLGDEPALLGGGAAEPQAGGEQNPTGRHPAQGVLELLQRMRAQHLPGARVGAAADGRERERAVLEESFERQGHVRASIGKSVIRRPLDGGARRVPR
jgi:hypothetical protein